MASAQGHMQTLLSQRDIHWCNHLIGVSRWTIGSQGCWLTCLSMTSAEFGAFQDPARIAEHSTMFTTAGQGIYSQVQKFVPHLKFVWRQYGNSPETIENFISYGYKATHLQVPINAAQNSFHWLKVIKKVQLKKGVDYLCNNPWTGQQCYAKATYGQITGSCHFVKA